MLDPPIPRHTLDNAAAFPQGDPRMAEITPSTCTDDGSVLSAGALAESMRAALSGTSAEESLRVVIALAVDTAPCDQATITMLGPGRTVRTVAASDDRVAKADLLQYQLGQGPGLDAAGSDELVLVEDLAADRRWPRWASLAAGFGIGSLVAVHLHADHPLGAVNLYSERPRDYDDIDLQGARVVAAHASAVLAHIHTTQGLHRAVDTSTLIGQAQGILMARYGLTPDKAFAVLRRYSQTTNTPIAAIAQELTSTGKFPGLERQIHPVSPRLATPGRRQQPAPGRATRPDDTIADPPDPRRGWSHPDFTWWCHPN